MAWRASVVAGVLLVAVAFLAAFHVADTRQGLIAEVVTLLSGLSGVGLLLYGLVPKRRSEQPSERPLKQEARTGVRSANDLLIGSAGLLLAAVLLGGLAITGGWPWAALGAVLLLPMMIGSGYLCAAFIKAPVRDWNIDLRRLIWRR